MYRKALFSLSSVASLSLICLSCVDATESDRGTEINDHDISAAAAAPADVEPQGHYRQADTYESATAIHRRIDALEHRFQKLEEALLLLTAAYAEELRSTSTQSPEAIYEERALETYIAEQELLLATDLTQIEDDMERAGSDEKAAFIEEADGDGRDQSSN